MSEFRYTFNGREVDLAAWSAEQVAKRPPLTETQKAALRVLLREGLDPVGDDK